MDLASRIPSALKRAAFAIPFKMATRSGQSPPSSPLPRIVAGDSGAVHGPIGPGASPRAGHTSAVTPVRQVYVDFDGSTQDVGDIAVVNGFGVRGTVRLSDDKPVPAGYPAKLI